jgi:hypothetical protein
MAAIATTTAKSIPASAQNKAEWPSLLEAKDIAEEGFIYGLPLVMNYAVMQEFAVDKNSGQFKAPFNEINNQHRVATPEDTAVITPNSDTPYSMLWLDLRAESMVISVPMIEKDRYYSVQFIDGNTYNYGYIGTRATGTEAGDYLVVGPDWKGGTPTGIKKVFQSTTPFTLALFRTQLFSPGDMSNVEKIQAGYNRAAEQRDELAAFHSITSSARASSVGGISRPSALAVLRFPSDYRPPSMSRCRKSSLQQSDGHLSCENLPAAFQVRSLRDPYPQALPCHRSHSQIYCALQDYISVRLAITSGSEMLPNTSHKIQGYRSVSMNTSQPISPNACLILFFALSAAV